MPVDREPPDNSSTHQLEELLADPDFLRIIELITREIMRSWRCAHNVAHDLVLSAIGTPDTLACIHDAWTAAKDGRQKPGLAMAIVRRRALDLLRKDARRTNHCSLSTTAEAVESGGALVAFDDLLQGNPQAQLELQQVIRMVRTALSCFASQGQTQQRQALLLRRYTLDEASYTELSREYTCSEGALRVRVFKAMLALRRHIQHCHPDLEDFLEHRRWT
jgi:DNA-directed RNA polymerase specialized sigma24 family protein